MNRWLLVPLFSSILAGCASVPDLPKGYALDANGSEGLVIASATLTGKSLDQFTEMEFNIRQIPPRGDALVTKTPRFSSANQHARWVAAGGEPSQGKGTWSAIVKGINSAEPLDIVEGNKPSGRLMSLRLPAGEYEVYSWKAVERTTYGGMEYKPEKTFSHRFTIRSGEATYLGRIQLQLGDNDQQKVVIADQKRADLDLFRSKYPKVAERLMFSREREAL